MQSLLDEITKESVWNEYLEFKREQISCSKKEIEELEKYINNKEYKDIAQQIAEGNYIFSIPEKHLINKIDKSKKRVVYTFNYDETMILKLLTYIFTKRYDHKYSDNCYSFRRKYTIKDAIYKLIDKKNDVRSLKGYKIDISNYFNSIDLEILSNKLDEFIDDDKKLLEFIKSILKDNRVYFNKKVITESKGIMAGIPISSFLANIYLKDVDDYFKNKGVIYLRYSDDIILFSHNIEEDSKKLDELILKNKLTINNDKKEFIGIGDKWSFLGFSYYNGIIDISEISKKKIKGKIKRASRKLRRWMVRKNETPERAAFILIRKFNNKFFYIDNKKELTWQLWYFPIINTSKGLEEIDLYLQQYIRYIYTGKFGKKNYELKYIKIKELGYKTLVNEYYKFKKTIIVGEKQ